jgi:hypothetical protein
MTNTTHRGANASQALNVLDGILGELRAHLADPDATLNDDMVETLYRQYYRIPADRDTDLEAVERWAVRHASA